MHEILTLQFGQRANYVATHFWNLQESYFTYTPSSTPSIVDHDVHFRAGIGIDGSDTYTPRTVIYDLKRNFGSLKKLNALYDDTSISEITALWRSPAVPQKQPEIVPAHYQRDLDLGLPTSRVRREDVRYWSDFNRVFYHPRSIVQLGEHSLGSSLSPFESWSIGEELFNDVDREADLLDRDVRPFAEEADQMQGIQVFTGTDDAWGGWASTYLDALRDEFGKKSIWVWGLEDTRRVERQKMLARAANAARTLHGIGTLASAYVRLANVPVKTPRYVHNDETSEWATSALLATAIESITLPTRLRGGSELRQARYADLEHFLNTNGGQSIYELGLSAKAVEDFPVNNAEADTRMQDGAVDSEEEARVFDLNLTPAVGSLLPVNATATKTSKHVFAQTISSRQPGSATHLPNMSYTPDREDLLRRRYNDETIIDQFNIPLAIPELDTMPQNLIYPPQIENFTAEKGLVLSCGLSSSANIKKTVFDLRDLVIRHSHVVPVDEREDLYDGLTEAGDKYTFGWEDDESDDED